MTDPNFYSLADKVAIVTGAAHGIGAAIAERFLKAGARVVFADIDAVGARDRAGQLDGSGERSLVAPVNLTTVRRGGHSGGAGHRPVRLGGYSGEQRRHCRTHQAPGGGYRREEWDQVMAVNLRGVFLCCRAVLPTHAEASVRPDRQRGLHCGQGGESQPGALLDHQGRGDLPHQGPGQGGLPAGHLRELRDPPR